MATEIPASLEDRLTPFLDRGLLYALPNRWQIFQGTLEMTPFVLSPDVTSEESYRSHILANAVVRQPFLIRLIGLDHLSTGTGLSVKLSSICMHLMLTWHEGMPTYDLQIVQTHPGGLDALRRQIDGALNPQTAQDRRLRQQADRLFPNPAAYFALFTQAGGWIDRAAAFDYPSAAVESGTMPDEFYSLVSFLNHCLTLPKRPSNVGWPRVPAHLARLLSRRLRTQNTRTWLRAT
ncbi:MAG: hypothetical protein GWP91_08370 [Rhodobacterales bacterium]|nr:hypothetical protein [Rhodobacterales bacterium]